MSTIKFMLKGAEVPHNLVSTKITCKGFDDLSEELFFVGYGFCKSSRLRQGKKEKRKKGKKSCSDSVLIHVERYFEAECEKNFAE
jgi:hypothetical protein